ncbi:MAG: Spy/CpxP family protein refolding chaperone [Candidatus Eisenbacteria bacterium]|nr:Spy/CpxP family protein refolding chaperone [Candidatus Eisenbacteria bacterium]
MKRTSVCIVALVALACASIASAEPAGGPPKGEPGPGRMARVQKLQLSDSQKSQLREKRFAAAHRRIELHSRLAEARLCLHELMSGEKLDEAAIRTQARVVGELQGQAAQQRIEDHVGMLTVLTPEQRKTVHQLRPGMRGMRGPAMWMGGHGMGGSRMGGRNVRVLRFGEGQGAGDGENMEMLHRAIPGGPGAVRKQVRIVRPGQGSRVEIHGVEPGDESGDGPGDVRIIRLGLDGPDAEWEAMDGLGAGLGELGELGELGDLSELGGDMDFLFGPGFDGELELEEVL